MVRKGLFFAVLTFLIATAFGPAAPLQGAPYPPTLTSPGDGQTADSNPPNLCAQASDPDGNLQAIKFEVNGGGEGDHISPWIPVDGNGSACWQDSSPWSEQTHAWQARAVDTDGNQSGASPQWKVNIPSSGGGSTPETCSVDTLSPDVSAPQAIGVTVNFTVSASCTSGVDHIKVSVDGAGNLTIQGGSGVFSWMTSPFSPGNHVVSVQAIGNSGGTASRSHPYDLTSGAPPPPPQVNCSITSFNISPSSPVQPGTKVAINGTGSCDVGVRAMRIKIDGGNQYEIGTLNISWNWDTNGWSSGSHTVMIQVAGNGDTNWSQAGSQSATVTISQSSNTSTNPNDYFTTGDVIKIGSNVFVITREGSAIQRRLVPNPATRDALGISESMINNKGFSDNALKTLGQGSDIPDVTIDPSGFATFKSTFLPNLTPIGPGNPGQPSGPNSPNLPGTEGVCSGWNTRLKLGDLAKINGEGDQLKLRQSPSASAGVITEMPTGYQLQVIGGPRCNDGFSWWQISTPDGIGWAAEGKDKYWMSKPIGSAPPPIVPPTSTFTPAPQPQQPNQPSQPNPIVPAPIQPETTSSPISGINWCDVPLVNLFACPPKADAATNTQCYPQCVVEAERKRKDMATWSPPVKGYLQTPKDILNNARAWEGKPFLLDNVMQEIRVRNPGEVPQANDLIIWPKGCGDPVFGIVSFDGGHIGVVNSNQNGHLVIHDANWNNKCGIRDEEVVLSSCMVFITAPYIPQGYQSVPSKQNQSVNQCAQYNWPKSWLCAIGLIK